MSRFRKFPQALKLTICTTGDSSVGISPDVFEIKTPFYTLSKKEREQFKKEMIEALEGWADSNPAMSYFSDECEECGRRLKSNKCPSGNRCMIGQSQIEEEEAIQERIATKVW